MGLRGPAKTFRKEARIDLTDGQFWYLKTVAGNESVASVVRAMIQRDLQRRLLEEVAHAQRPGTTAGKA
jgi:hypothetical protein